jgi:hypothetical protein
MGRTTQRRSMVLMKHDVNVAFSVTWSAENPRSTHLIPLAGQSIDPNVFCTAAAVVSLDLHGNAITVEGGELYNYRALLSLSLADNNMAALPHPAEQVLQC